MRYLAEMLNGAVEQEVNQHIRPLTAARIPPEEALFLVLVVAVLDNRLA
jgi:hypothetical protein